MPLYKVARWDSIYETAETRKLENLRWVPMPNKLDGLGLRRVAAHRDRCDLFAAWVLLVEIASKGRRGERGTLSRDGEPLSADDLALMTGFPSSIFDKALAFFSDPKQGWLAVEAGESPARPADSPAHAASSPAVWKGREGMEGNEKNGIEQKGSEPKSAPPTETIAAAVIYDLYPRKVARKDALKAIETAMKSRPAQYLLAQTKAYAAAVAIWPEHERKYVPHPATWFNRESFDDDPVTWIKQPAGANERQMRAATTEDFAAAGPNGGWGP